MDKSPEQKSPATFLYPPIEPFERRMLDVGDGHEVYLEQCGRTDGVPVIVLHGGPGGGSSPMMRRFFDPAVYRVVLFDQRGCGRSRPHACVAANTTQDLIADIERIRRELGIERWIVFGGSWGATLALAYAQTHPDRAAYLVLRGIFLGTVAELAWFYGGGAGKFHPELWARFTDPIPENERGDLITAYHARLFSGVFATETRYARLWAEWENALATVNARPLGDTPVDYARAFARLENHYFMNRCFLDFDGQLLAEIGRMAGVPGTIVQGRLDMICPPGTAWALHRAWPQSELRMVPLAGHALSEPAITAELVTTMDTLRRQRVALQLD